jgi:ADP-heptose:LPS heptosyltransferase
MNTSDHVLGTRVRRIAILRALFLGDLLLSGPAMRALRRRFPAAEISLIGLPWAAEIVRRSAGALDRLVPFEGYQGLREVAYDPARAARFLQAQRAYGYDLAVQMHGDGSVSNGLVAALGARLTLGCARPGDGRLDLALPYRDDDHETLRWLSLLGLLGVPDDDARLDLALVPDDMAEAQRLLAPALRPGSLLIGLHPGAKDPARRWPVKSFAALGDVLAQRYGASLVLTGAANEAGLTAELWARLRVPALDLGGRTSLGAFAATISALDLLVTNDTGASHLAAARATPSVVLFGPTRPHVFAPLNRRLHMVVDALAHAPSLPELTLDPVLAACEAQLAARIKRKHDETPEDSDLAYPRQLPEHAGPPRPRLVSAD